MDPVSGRKNAMIPAGLILLALACAITVLGRGGRGRLDRLDVASTHHLSFAARADRVLSVGPDGVDIGTPARILASDRIRALFRVEISGCPCCGQALS